MNSFIFNLPLRSNEEGVDIFFIGDEQEGSDGFRVDAWESYVEDYKRSKNPYVIHMADPRDWLRPSMRDKIEAIMVRDASMKKQLDDMVYKGLEQTYERLKFMKGRLLGMHEGHHDYDFQSGQNATQMLAQKLGAVNMGWVANTRFNIIAPRGIETHAFTMASSHGNASGKNTTAVAQSVETSMKDSIVDLKVQGHACRSANWTPHEYHIVNRKGPAGYRKIIPRHLLVGGFCEGYTDGWISRPKEVGQGERRKLVGGRPTSGYAERRNLTPQPLMWGKVTIKMRQCARAAKERGARSDSRALDVEVVNRGPAVDPNGLYW